MDRCSSLHLEDVAPTSRARTYAWSSAHAPLHEAIKDMTTYKLENLPADLLPDDEQVTITVVSTDFLGSSSPPVSVGVQKSSVPTPQVRAHTHTYACMRAYVHTYIHTHT